MKSLRRPTALGRAVAYCALAAVPLAAARLAAQDPLEPPVPPAAAAPNQVPPAPPAPPDNAPPRLPETVVPGGRNAGTDVPSTPFPANPLQPETVLTPTRTEVPISTVGSSVTVITRDEINRRGYQNALEVLRNQLGVDVANAGGPGRQSSVFLRGANSAQTKVLIDGIPANDPSNPSRAFDFGLLTVDNLERIEVLRGPQSTLYGSDAIGGVVNLITRRGEGPLKVRASTAGGAFGTTVQTISASGGTDEFYYSLGSSYQDSRGYSATTYGGERDGYHMGAISTRFGWTPSEDFDVDCTIRTQQSNVDLDAFLFDDPLRINRLLQNFARVQARAVVLDGMAEQKIGVSIADHRRDDPTALFGPSRFEGTTYRLDWQSNLTVSDTNVLTTGIDVMREEGFTNIAPRLEYLTDVGFYVEDNYRIGERFFGTIGARWDNYSQAGPANTYRATGRYWIYETGTSIKGTIGTGFRAPTISDLITGFGANPDLLPEESKGWDYGIEQSLFDNAVVAGVTYFRNDFTNLIDFDNTFSSLYNIGLARSTGIEVSVQAVVDQRTSLGFFYTHQDPINLLTGNELLRRPKDKYLLTVNRQVFDRGQATLSVLYAGNRKDFGNVNLAAYTSVALSGSWQLTDQVQLFARLDNLFNEKYEEVEDFTVPGTTLFGGIAVGSW